MRLPLALAAMLFVSPAWADSGFVMIGQKGRMGGNFIGCKDQADETKFRTLVSEGDKEAAVVFGDRLFPACQHVTTGMIGTIEDLSAWHATSCFRLQGEPDCFWVPTNLIIKP